MVKQEKYDKIYLGVSYYFWQKIFPQVKRIKGYKCEECGSTENLDIHHTRKDLININTVNYPSLNPKV